MTYRAWWAARRLLFEERFGALIREHEHEQQVREAKQVADYHRSLAYLKQRQADGAG